MTPGLQSIETEVAQMAAGEIRDLFGRVFGDREGQKALMLILAKVGGIADLRGRASPEQRMYLDGKRDAALEIMKLAGFSPYQLTLRLLDLKPLDLKDLENATSPSEDRVSTSAPRARGRSARAKPAASGTSAAPAAGDIASGHDFAGD